MAVFVTCAVHAAVVSSAAAQPSCVDWNTGAFFKEAQATDVARGLTAGADPGAWDNSGWTPLHWAAASGTTLAVVQVLLEAGTHPGAAARTGETPLHLAAVL